MIKEKSFVLAEAMLALALTTAAILFMSDLQNRQRSQITELQKEVLFKRDQLSEAYFRNDTQK